MAKGKKDTGGPVPPKRRLKTNWGTNGPRPNNVGELTPTQCKLLGELLLKQQGSAVEKCKVLFALTVGNDEKHGLLARLRGEGGVFRCEVCQVWQEMREAAEYLPTADPEDVCQSCDDTPDGDDPDEGAEADRLCR